MIRKDILGKRLNNETFVINTTTKEVGYIVENNRVRCISLLDKSDYYRTYDKTVEDFSEWCGIRADSVTIKQYECLKYNVWLDKKGDRKRKTRDDVPYKLYKKYDRISNATKLKKALDYIINHKEILIPEDELRDYLEGSPLIMMNHLYDEGLVMSRYMNGDWRRSYYFLTKNKEKALELLKW